MVRGGLRRAGPLPPEVVLETHDVVELRGGHLHQLGPLDRLVAVDPTCRDVPVVAGHQLLDADLAGVVLEVEAHPAGRDEDRFVLDHVLLEREPPARLDDQDLAHVAVGDGPDQLVAPLLVDSSGAAATAAIGHAAHASRTRRSPALSMASWIASEVASV